MNQNIKKIFIIAGETSGDMHGSEMVKAIKEKRNNIDFSGIGGELLKSAGIRLIHNFSEVNFIGFSAVLKNYSRIKSILNRSVEYIRDINPEIVILIDFPGFNLRFAESIRKFYNGKIIYYISPQVWAWHKSRVNKMKQLLDLMLVIFPFEVDFYKKEGIQANYVGHPLIRRIDDFMSTNCKVKSDKLNITLLPGTRIEEIYKMFPILSETSKRFNEEYDAQINIVYPENIEIKIYSEYNKKQIFNFIANKGSNIYTTLLNSDLVITKFGTSTLECALLGIPFISVYKANFLNYIIAKTLSNIKYVSLPNIIMKKEIVKEFLQGEMTPDNLYNEGKRILFDSGYADNMKNNFKEMRNIFTNTHIEKSAEEIIIDEL